MQAIVFADMDKSGARLFYEVKYVQDLLVHHAMRPL